MSCGCSRGQSFKWIIPSHFFFIVNFSIKLADDKYQTKLPVTALEPGSFHIKCDRHTVNCQLLEATALPTVKLLQLFFNSQSDQN